MARGELEGLREGEKAELYFVVDLRKEWTRNPYITLWGPENAGYFYSLPRSGRYTDAEIEASGSYHTRRRYLPSRKGYVGRWERFAVPCGAIEALAIDPDTTGRGRLDPGAGPVVRNSAEMRARLVSLRRGAPAKIALLQSSEAHHGE